MGFFSDKCEALIDSATNRVLQGDALFRARANPEAPRCGNKVPKAARFCNKCGSSAPGAWWKCHGCGKWVGAESNYCWNCKAVLHVGSRDAFSEGTWQREAGAYARLVKVAELRKLVERGLNVQVGTVAVLIEDGVIKAVLEPGRHTLETMKRRFAGLFTEVAPQLVLLLDAGDIVLPLRFSSLRTREELAVDCYTEVSFRAVPAAGLNFLANVLKSQEQLSYEGLADWLRQEMRSAVAGMVQTSGMDDLVRDPNCRLPLEDALRNQLAVLMGRAGVELIRVASVEFTGVEYEQLREQAGQVEVKRRQIEFQQRLRELTTGDAMGQFKSEHDLAEYVQQLAQEKSVAGELQAHELARLKQVHRHELAKDDAAYQMAAEIEQTAHGIHVKMEWDVYTRDKLLKDAEVQAKVKAIESSEEVRQAYEWLKVRAEKSRLDLESKKAQAEAFAKFDIKTLIALLPDEAQRRQLLELNRQTSLAGQSPEQLLAAAADKNPAAATALARMRELKREDLEREFKDRKALTDESAARLERILAEALKAMGEASRPRN
jgi:SPFH domain / Band 7 family